LTVPEQAVPSPFVLLEMTCSQWFSWCGSIRMLRVYA
jgi:hypothetical protein